MHVISVAPAEGGWKVSSDGFFQDMMFLSGARAEKAARKLGEKIAHSGRTAEIRIYIRDGALAGRFVCPPAMQPALAL